MTTAQLSALAQQAARLAQTLRGRAVNGWENHADINAWRAATVGRLHQVLAPQRRPYAAAALAAVLVESLKLGQFYVEWASEAQHELDDAQHWLAQSRAKCDRLTAENARLQAEVERITAQLARRPMAAPVEIPAQTVTLRSEIDQELMRLLAVEGLARSWRLIARVLALGVSKNANTVRNAFKRLQEEGLLEEFTWNGRAQHWTPVAGGKRALYRLTEKGRAFVAQAYQQEAAPCELDAMVLRHKSVEHAVGILEARDHLAVLGYQVDAAPTPLLFDESQPHGQRVEPDLIAQEHGLDWLVEVQREVDARNNDKWGKCLAIHGRLLLLVFNEQGRERQAYILKQATHWQLPPGEIRLGSLEALEQGRSEWTVIRSSIHR